MILSPELPKTMRAWVAQAYGAPDVLALRDLPVPNPGPRDVLIRVQASTVSSADRRIRALDFPRGMKWLGRAFCGWRRPRRPVLGVEFTGIVAGLGAQARRFSLGDAVIAFSGIRGGGHAEYAVMPEDGMIAPRPMTMAIEQAAALTFGGSTALHFLRRAGLRSGETLLVIGASGAVGSAIVQIAGDAGAQITGIASTANRDLVLSLGATHFIDYTKQNFVTEGARYDLVADTIGTLDFPRALPLLKEGGRFLAINGGIGDMLVRPRGTRRAFAGPAAEKQDYLTSLIDLSSQGRFRPVIDSILPFEQLPAAHARADSMRKRGSVVLRIGERQGDGF